MAGSIVGTGLILSMGIVRAFFTVTRSWSCFRRNRRSELRPGANRVGGGAGKKGGRAPLLEEGNLGFTLTGNVHKSFFSNLVQPPPAPLYIQTSFNEPAPPLATPPYTYNSAPMGTVVCCHRPQGFGSGTWVPLFNLSSSPLGRNGSDGKEMSSTPRTGKRSGGMIGISATSWLVSNSRSVCTVGVEMTTDSGMLAMGGMEPEEVNDD